MKKFSGVLGAQLLFMTDNYKLASCYIDGNNEIKISKDVLEDGVEEDGS